MKKLAIGLAVASLICFAVGYALGKALDMPPESVDDGQDEFWIED